MCTLSLIPLRDSAGSLTGYRVACNRDESHARPPAAAPRWRSSDGVRALWPMDMEAGGTWIGASDSGLTLAILNLNPDPPAVIEPPPNARSRGLVIPDLIGSPTAVAAIDRLSRMPLEHYSAFRLIAVGGAQDELRIAEARWDRQHFGVAWFRAAPMAFVSSGLGDSKVLARLDLFEDMVVVPGPSPELQDAYHRHTWDDRPEISVLMRRDEARTVSITTLEVARGCPPQMIYESIPAHPLRRPANRIFQPAP
jgi:uncharacterized protein with NRDE domain